MLKKTIALLTLMIFIFIYIPVCAENQVVVSLNYNAEKSEINLSGTAYGRVNVIIIDSSVLPENISINDILYSNQFVATGSFLFDITLSDSFESGKYSVILTTADGEATESFTHMNTSAAFDVLDTLSKKDTLEAFIEEIEKGENAKTLGIDKDDIYYAENKDYTYKMLYELNKDYKDPILFNEIYYKLYAISIIYGGDEKEILDATKKYADKLLIDFANEFEKDARLSEDAKKQLFNVLSKIDFLNEFKSRGAIDFGALLEESKYVSVMAEATNWQALKQAVTVDFSSFLNVNDNSTYAKINNKNKVFSKMMKYTYASYSDIEEAFEESLDKVYDEENKKSNVSGGGTGGGSASGGSSGKGVLQIPADIEETFPTENKLNFTDFSESHWSYDAVLSLCKDGYINGYEDNTFRPDNNITRAEFVKIIVEAGNAIFKEGAGEKETYAKAADFSDVNASDWFYESILAASKKGFVNGSNGLFKPHDEITREDAVVIIYRVLSAYKTPSGNKVFSDRSEISEYARVAVATLGAIGIVNGDGEGFKPKNSLTRAQAAQLVYNIKNYN